EDTGAFGPAPADRAPEPAPPSAAVLGSGEEIAHKQNWQAKAPAPPANHIPSQFLSPRARRFAAENNFVAPPDRSAEAVKKSPKDRIGGRKRLPHLRTTFLHSSSAPERGDSRRKTISLHR